MGIGNVGQKKVIAVEEVVEEEVIIQMSKEEKIALLVPKVHGSKFVGLASLKGPKAFKSNMTLTQCFSCLFKFVKNNERGFPVRSIAFDQGYQQHTLSKHAHSTHPLIKPTLSSNTSSHHTHPHSTNTQPQQIHPLDPSTSINSLMLPSSHTYTFTLFLSRPFVLHS